MKRKNIVITLLGITLLVLLILILFLNQFGFLSIYQVRPSDLVIDINKNCVVLVDAPWSPTAQKTCVWEGYLDAPKNTENLTFYVSIEGEPNVGTSKKDFKLEVWTGVSWKELFYKQLTAIEGSQETTMSEKPGELIYACHGSSDSPCYGKYEYIYACETNAGLPLVRDPAYTYTCIKYPDCYNLPRDGMNRYFCTMPKVFLDKRYVIDEKIRFRTSATLIQGSGNTYMDPIGHGAISIFNSEFGILFTDLCKNVICDDYCEDSIRYYGGYCSEGECNYKEVVCEYGCQGDLCEGNPCEGIECPDLCENSIYKFNGECVNGRCIYASEISCEYGCQGEPIIGTDMCRDNPCTGVTCSDYCSANSLFYDGVCVNGKCTGFKEKEFAEECGYAPIYSLKGGWIYYIIAVIFILVVAFSIVYYRRRK